MSARDPQAPWFPESPQLGTERIRHGTWKRTGPYDLGDVDNDTLKRNERQCRRVLEDIEDGLERPGLRPEHGRLAVLGFLGLDGEVALERARAAA